MERLSKSKTIPSRIYDSDIEWLHGNLDDTIEKLQHVKELTEQWFVEEKGDAELLESIHLNISDYSDDYTHFDISVDYKESYAQAAQRYQNKVLRIFAHALNQRDQNLGVRAKYFQLESDFKTDSILGSLLNEAE